MSSPMWPCTGISPSPTSAWSWWKPSAAWRRRRDRGTPERRPAVELGGRAAAHHSRHGGIRGRPVGRPRFFGASAAWIGNGGVGRGGGRRAGVAGTAVGGGGRRSVDGGLGRRTAGSVVQRSLVSRSSRGDGGAARPGRAARVGQCHGVGCRGGVRRRVAASGPAGHVGP